MPQRETEMNKEYNINKAVNTYSGELEITGSLRDVPEVRKTRRREVTYITGKAKNPGRISFGTMFTMCMFFIVFMFVLLLNVRINEVSREIASIQDEIATVRLEKSAVSAKLSEKNDLGMIKELAEEYGMVRDSELPSRHVTVNSEDEVVVISKEETEEKNPIAVLLDAFGSSFDLFVEYLK